jgi:hypothetical protein
MKKLAIILVIILIAVAVAIVFYIFEHETVNVGKYNVVYYKNQCDNIPESLPQDLTSLKTFPCLIRITWQERISSDMFQEYCYLPGKEVEKSRIIHNTK